MHHADDDDICVVDVQTASSPLDLDAHAKHQVERIDAELALVREQLAALRKREKALLSERAHILAEQREVNALDESPRTMHTVIFSGHWSFCARRNEFSGSSRSDRVRKACAMLSWTGGT